MITEEHIKEAISLRYLELVAAYNGYNANRPSQDYGVDLEIKEVEQRTVDNKYFPTGRCLNLQVKATTENGVIIENNLLKYDLATKNYNDLIQSKTQKSQLILIVFVLPKDKDEWLKISDKELFVKKCAYWFIPERDNFSNNTSSIRISIDKNKQLIQTNTLNQLFELYS